jgi:HEAT repeat protein
MIRATEELILRCLGLPRTRSQSIALHFRRQVPLATIVFVLAVIALPRAVFADTIQEILDADTLADSDNPVAARYFVEQGRGVLAKEMEDRAVEQMRISLMRQTSVMGRVMQGMAGMMSGSATQKMRQQSQEMMQPTSIGKMVIGGALGIPPPTSGMTQREGDLAQQEMRQGFADPWIRGIEAAKALEGIGEAQAAGQFYVNCIQLVMADWMKDSCLNAILAMGPRRAYVLLSWLTENAEQASITSSDVFATDSEQSVDQTVVQLRGAALRGLGTLIGSSAIKGDEREHALALILSYADGKQNAAYFADAATGLGRAGDPRGLASLKRLAKYRKDEVVEDAAQVALATGFKDQAAITSLRGELDNDNADRAMRMATALLSAGDEASFQWAVEVVTKRRASDRRGVDLRPRIVRELAAVRTDRAYQALTQIFSDGAGNDWLQAWTAVALLELGDTARLPQVSAALAKTDWTLDRSGLRTFWSRISPILNLAVGAMTSAVDVQKTMQVVGGMIAAERTRFLQKATDRELLSGQFRWQAADALALSDDPAAAGELTALLDDPELAVRMSAARALVAHSDSRSLDGIVKAFALDFGEENGVSRGPEVRAALLRSALLQFPDDPRTRTLCKTALADADSGVRFIAAVALKRT